MRSKIRERICTQCDKLFTLGANSNRYKFCSDECTRLNKNEYMSNWGQEHKELLRDRYLRKTYGIGSDEVERLLTLQGDTCAICGRDEPTGNGWHVDHNHATGSIRGVLCSKCNQALGLVDENKETLKKMLRYLEKELVDESME